MYEASINQGWTIFYLILQTGKFYGKSNDQVE